MSASDVTTVYSEYESLENVLMWQCPVSEPTFVISQQKRSWPPSKTVVFTGLYLLHKKDIFAHIVGISIFQWIKHIFK